MKFLSTLFLFVTVLLSSGFTLTEYQKNPRTLFHLNTVIGQYPQDQLIQELRSFANCCRPSRLIASKGNEEAFAYLEKKLKEKKTGTLKVHSFTSSPEYKNNQALLQSQRDYIAPIDKIEGKNLIWEKKGESSSDEVLMISAYFDNLTLNSEQQIDTSSISVGADNNATGVAALLGLVEFLDLMPLKKTVRVIFLNYGEWDALGLYQYLYDHQKELTAFKSATLIQVQMLGHSSARTHQHQRENQLRLYVADSKDLEQAQQLQKHGARMSNSMDFIISKGAVAGRFEQGANLLLTQDLDFDKNPRHHSTDDFVETINSSYYTQSFRILAGMVLSWAFNLEK